MARYGFRITDPVSGVVQIDDTYANLCVIYKGTLAPGTHWTQYATGWYTDVTVTTDGTYIPLLAFKTGDASVYPFILEVTLSGNTWTWRVMSVNANGSASTPPPAYTFWVLGRGAKSATGTYGIRVRDGNNYITFDSGNKYARVIGSFTANFSDIFAGTAGGNIGFAESVAFVPGTYGFQISVHAFPPIPSQFAWQYVVSTFTNAADNIINCSAINVGFDNVTNQPLTGGGTRQRTSGIFVATASLG